MNSLKKITAEIILMSMFLPWAIWVTVSIFSGQTAQAVTENNYVHIIDKIDDLKKAIMSKKE